MTQRVSGADLTWLELDRPDNPMMITGIMTFADHVSEDRILAILEDRLVSRFPKFTWRVVHEGKGRAWWEPDPCFDLRAHVHRVALPSPGGRVGLMTLVGQLMSTRLDPEQALWHVALVEDYEGGTALIIRLHHVLADGISLARVLLQLADESAPGAAFYDGSGRTALAEVTKGLSRLWTVGRSWLTDAGALVDAVKVGASGAGAVGELLLMAPEPPSLLRGPIGPRKVAAWLDPIPLARVKAIGRASGATVNDVLLAALGQALGRYVREHGGTLPSARTFVPVNLRPLDRPIPRDLGNHFGLVLLDLPTPPLDPDEAIGEMKAKMDAIKASPQAVLTYTTLQAMASAPEAVSNLLVDHFSARASLITTNVPGPRERITVDGHVVTGILCWVPQSSAVALGVSILSYAGEVHVGVASDARRIPDPAALARAYAASIEAMGGEYDV